MQLAGRHQRKNNIRKVFDCDASSQRKNTQNTPLHMQINSPAASYKRAPRVCQLCNVYTGLLLSLRWGTRCILLAKGFLFLSSLGKNKTLLPHGWWQKHMWPRPCFIYFSLCVCVCVRTKKCILLSCFVANAIWFACYKIHFVPLKEILWVNPDFFFFFLTWNYLSYLSSPPAGSGKRETCQMRRGRTGAWRMFEARYCVCCPPRSCSLS